MNQSQSLIMLISVLLFYFHIKTQCPPQNHVIQIFKFSLTLTYDKILEMPIANNWQTIRCVCLPESVLYKNVSSYEYVPINLYVHLQGVSCFLPRMFSLETGVGCKISPIHLGMVITIIVFRQPYCENLNLISQSYHCFLLIFLSRSPNILSTFLPVCHRRSNTIQERAIKIHEFLIN